jgi:hypothetical protein
MTLANAPESTHHRRKLLSSADRLQTPTGSVSHLTLAALTVAFTTLVVLTWARWGHVRIDCGGSLDRAARIAEGAVLYRDVLSPYGPVGCYTIAALFRIFGIHLSVVYAAGLALLVAESCLLWTICRRFLGELECAVGLVAFWVLFGFQPGFLNWVLPNTFASTFGAFFATGALALVLRYHGRGEAWQLVGASLCTAAAGLSKAEFGLAAFATLMVAVVSFPRPSRGRAKAVALLVVPGLLLSGVVAGIFVCLVPWRQLLFDNVYRLRSFERSVPAYRAGLFPPLGPVVRDTLLRYGIELPARAAIVSAGLGTAMGGGVRRLLGIGLATAALLVPLVPGYPPLPDFFRSYAPARQFVWSPMAWALLAALAFSVTYKKKQDGGLRALALVATFSVFLAVRWELRVAWPSFYAVFAPFLTIFVVRFLASRVVAPGHAGTAAALVIAVAVATGGADNWRIYNEYVSTLGYPRGTIRTTRVEGELLRQTVDYVRSNTTVDDYVAVMPEERLINFLAERRHPTRDPGVGPGWLATAEDEERFIREIEEKGTPMIVLSARRYPEFGAGSFASYSPGIMRYITREYRKVWSVPGAYSVYRRKGGGRSGGRVAGG